MASKDMGHVATAVNQLEGTKVDSNEVLMLARTSLVALDPQETSQLGLVLKVKNMLGSLVK